MDIKLEQNLIDLADISPKPLYVVGGYVRNFLLNGTVSDDIDLASPMTVEELLPLLKVASYKVVAEYKRTNTVIFQKGNGIKYEFTTFRTDSYNDGGHTPTEVLYTDKIELDAIRRDFKCNAIYFDIKKGEIVDPLNGVQDVKNRILDTVQSPDKVFKDDGLRIMRLCRLYGELGFTPTKEVIESALKYKNNLKEISAERILVELKRILVADGKYPFSPKNGHYNGLKMMCESGAMEVIFPEIYLGKGMIQRADYHNYDVLEHVLRTVLYADKSVRFASLMHDIGKPYCMQNFGKYHMHDIYGAKIAEKVLDRLKVSNSEKDEIIRLTKYHMLDVKNEARTNKIRLFIAENYDIFQKMLLLKQADFSACKDNVSVAPTVEKWQKIYNEMQTDNTPINIKMLKINGDDVVNLGVKGKIVGEVLEELWKHCIYSPQDNDREKLLNMAKNMVTSK